MTINKSLFKYLPAILLFFTACKKGEPLQQKQIKGIVVNTLTKLPVAGQKVELTIITQKTVKTNDPEWPSGKPVNSYTSYTSTSSQSGQYSFDVKIPNLPWSYYVTVPTGEYIMTYRQYHMFPIDERILSFPDSVFIERPGYIKYTIKTLGAAYENEALYISTPYHNRIIGPNNASNIYFKYNWTFFGKNDKLVLDTIPAESNTDPEVEWLRVITDTIQYKKERIHVQAGSTVNYLIQY